MTTITFFGLALAPLYSAIAQVESDRGATSANIYQIDAHEGGTYVADVNRILELRRRPDETRVVFRPGDQLRRTHAEYMMAVYWGHWGCQYERKTGKRVTYEVLARIHNGGPLGWKKPATVAYWNKVAAVMATQTREEVVAWSYGGAL